MKTSRDHSSFATPGARPRPLRVLVATGERPTANALGALLRGQGVEVQFARGGMQVPAAVAEFMPDAVLLDLAMPDHGGLQVAQELLQCYGRRCPVLVAVTSRASDADRSRALQSGFRHFVADPYDPPALVRLVLSLPRRMEFAPLAAKPLAH